MNRWVMAALAAVILVLVTVAALRPKPDDEHLVQLQPLPGGPWQERQRSHDDIHETLWVNRQKQQSLSVIVSRPEAGEPVMKFHNKDNAIGRKACHKYSSQILGNILDNGYPTLTSTSTCVRGDRFKSVTLRKVISGRDALYVVQKVWKDPVSSDSWNRWLGYLKRLRLCDDRTAEHPCPHSVHTVD
jgi:hypothetical protein